MENYQSKLSFSEFEVHFAYGFVVENGDEPTNVIRQLRNVTLPPGWSRYTTLGGWAILYRLRGIEDRLLHLSFSPENAKYRIAGTDLAIDFRARILLRSDGAGAVTLTFSVTPRKGENTNYNLDDLARVMSLVPRTYVDPAERTNDEKRFEVLQPAVTIPPGLTPKQQLLFNESSSAFQLFIQCVCQIASLGGVTWREVANHSDTDDLTPSMYSGEEEDPQIPYMYVFAKIPSELYMTECLGRTTILLMRRLL